MSGVTLASGIRFLVHWALLSSIAFCLQSGTLPTLRAETGFAGQSERPIPIVAEVDTVVVGGTLGGVAAAVSAAEAGSQVFLIAPKPYLGEDLCATLRLWRTDVGSPSSPLTNRIFDGGLSTTPLRVKKTLEEVLGTAGVRFLLSSYTTDLLQGSDGKLAGIVVGNRGGRQAIVSKVIIDASRMSWVARMAGATEDCDSSSPVLVSRVVVEGESNGDEEPNRAVPCPSGEGWQGLTCREYNLSISSRIKNFQDLARIEQEARKRTYRRGQLLSSEELFVESPVKYDDPQNTGILERQPGGWSRLYVLGTMNDGTNEQPGRDLHRLESDGWLLGAHAAKVAKSLSIPAGLTVRNQLSEPSTEGDVREVLRGFRPTDSPSRTVLSKKCTIPVLGSYDVVIVGGGTTGACAAIAAGRMGARVLVVEYQHGLGGTGTLGLIGKPYFGKSIGFSREVPFPNRKVTIEDKMEWFRKEIEEVGGTIWFGTIGCGTFVEGNRVRGAVVASPEGRGVVLASVVLDATGNADLAVSAGADYMYGGAPGDIAMQGAGLPARVPTSQYVNTDYLLVDESDMIDVWRTLVGVRRAMSDSISDSGTLIQTRERRRVVGDHLLSYLDQIAGRTYPDSIVLSGSDYDSHGYPSHPFFALLPHDKQSRAENHPAPGGSCFTPYRCLLPRDLEGIIVTGLGISMHRDATAMVRMQRDLHNQGYASGSGSRYGRAGWSGATLDRC